MARGVFVPIAGDPSKLIEAYDKSISAGKRFSSATKQIGVSAEQSARVQINASLRKDARLRQEIQTYRAVAAAAARGSREQVTAANLAVQAEAKLSRSLSLTSAEARRHAQSVKGAERELSRFSRGALAGSGIARGLGRSLAFASGGFLATASITGIFRAFITQGSQAAVTEKQLATQFRESGLELQSYRGQINATIGDLSKLSGFEDDELLRSFTTAFRATRDVSQALKIMSASANAARGSHRDLQSVTLGLTRAWGGAATSLRRLGILIPSTAKGMDAVSYVSRRFAGQAEAGATAQDRFRAAIANTEQTIGLGLLPQWTRMLDRGTDWLSQAKNQQRIQRDVNEAVRTGVQVAHGLADAEQVVAGALKPVVGLLGGTKNAAELAGLAFVGLKVKAIAAAFGLGVEGKAAEAAGAKTLVAGLRARAAAGNVSLLSTRLKGLPTKIGISLVVATEIYGPLKKFFEGKLGANFQGPQAAGDLVPVLRNGLWVDPNTGKPSPNQALAGRLAQQQFSGPTSGEDVALRGAGARQDTGTAGVTRGRLGLKARFAKLEFQLAQAELTATQADDRKILALQAQNLRDQLKTRKLSLADRTTLTQQLVGVENQIDAIDQAADQKQLDAQKKAAEKAKKHREELERAAKKRAAEEKRAREKAQAEAKKRAEEAKRAAKAARESARQAVQNERDAIGALFTGSVLNPTDDQRKLALGVPPVNASKLLADLKSQITAFKSFNTDLQKLARRGAPAELINELRAAGIAAAPQVHALATAGIGLDRQYFRTFEQRERLAAKTAERLATKVQVKVDIEVLDHRIGTRVRTTPTAQTSGRNAGSVPSSIGSFIR